VDGHRDAATALSADDSPAIRRRRTQLQGTGASFMSNLSASTALQGFMDSLEGLERVDPDVGRLVQRLHDEGSLTADVLVDALREMRLQAGQDGTTEAD